MQWRDVFWVIVFLYFFVGSLYALSELFRRSRRRLTSSRPTITAIPIWLLLWIIIFAFYDAWYGTQRRPYHALKESTSPTLRLPEDSFSLYVPRVGAPPHVTEKTQPRVDRVPKILTEGEKLERDGLDLVKGKIAIDVPEEMSEGDATKVEVRIARGVDQAIVKALKENLSSHAAVDELQVAPFMIVNLAADESIFKATPMMKAQQLVTGEGYTTWAWLVTPLESGVHSLYVTVGTRFRLPGRGEEIKFRPLYEKKIAVRVNSVYESERFLSGNWQWLTATILIPISTFLFNRWRKREPRTTILTP